MLVSTTEELQGFEITEYLGLVHGEIVSGANFLRVCDMIRSRLRANPVPIQLPIGAEDAFQGVIDLIKMKAIYWDMETQGMKFEFREIPAALKAQADHDPGALGAFAARLRAAGSEAR